MARLFLLIALLAPIVLATFGRPLEAHSIRPVIIELRDQADLSFAAAIADKDERGAAVYQALRRHASSRQALLLAELRARGIQARSFFITNAIAAELDRASAAALAARPEVARVVVDVPRRLQQPLPSDPEPQASDAASDVEWGIADIKADQVWSTYGVTGAGVVVAGNDTGIDWQHEALQAQYRGWDGSSASHDYNWHDSIHPDSTSNTDNPCGFDTTAPCDDSDHGTHTLGTIVGDNPPSGPPSDPHGKIGVAPGARWIGCRNMDENYGTIETYLECFEWLLAPTDSQGRNPRPDLAPDIVNNSWACTTSEGCEGDSLAALEPAVRSLTAAGILVVSSAGNSGWSGCRTITTPPAIYPDGVSVGAYDSNGAIAPFSSRGTVTYNDRTRVGPDLTAPGQTVLSSTRNNSYQWLSGTSMAAPHVAGAAALMWSAQPLLRGQIALTRQILERTARPTSAPDAACDDYPSARPNNVFGWGRLDALAAVEEALSIAEVTVRVTIDGSPAPGAQIVVSGPYRFSATANGTGQATFLLPADTYTISATAAGPASASKRITTGTSAMTVVVPLVFVYPRSHLPAVRTSVR